MDEAAYLLAVPSALIAVDRSLCIRFLNPAAEMLLGLSAQQAHGAKLHELPAFPKEVLERCEELFATGTSVSLHEQMLALPFNHRTVTMHITPVLDEPGGGREVRVEQLLMTIEKADGLDRMASSEWKQEVTRAAGVMAAMLAHEVKNPLSGIRGAAQLLKDEVASEHTALTELICMETDRIRDLLAQIDIFASGAPEEWQPVNIHEVLQYVIHIAQSGFARHVAFKEAYDPSLPPVRGRRELLVQLFLNLVKNAAEALIKVENPMITITTAYRGFSRVRLSQSDDKITLPLAVSIEDNGPGIAESMQARLFEPFVSSKEDGRGLGLAIVAKIASDVGAVVELDREFYEGAKFTVWLAVDNR